MSEKETLIRSKIEEFTNLVNSYTVHDDIIDPSNMEALKRLITDFQNSASGAIEENRLLRIGIVGQVKRGKSSFINANFFNGDDVLPKAATPMTAALTQVRYAEKMSAAVEFYSKEEWENIKEKALICEKDFKDSIDSAPEELKSCHELYEMIKKNNINPEEYFGEKREITGINSMSDLVGKFNEYVGAKGKFTPLVKNSELYINIEALKNIEIIDTPGLNDPIVSRGMKTKEFMGKCDVVILLSYCGQFLDHTDMGLLAQNIPNKGIRDIVLIGSLFDSVLMDEYKKYDSIQKAIPSLLSKLTNEAKSNFDKVRQENPDNVLSRVLEQAFPPIFVSSMAYAIAKNYDSLTEDQEYILTKLNKLYGNFKFTREILEQFSNFKQVKEKLEKIRENKDVILSERFNNIVSDYGKGFKNELKIIKGIASSRYSKLCEGDILKIEKEQGRIISAIEKGERKVNGIFEGNMIEIQKKLSELNLEIKKESINAKKISEQEGSEVRTSRSAKSGFWAGCARFFGVGGYETHRETVTYKYANVYDAVENLENFVMYAEEVIIKAVSTIIELPKFRKDIIESVRVMFDTSADDFDPDDILMPVTNAVNRITIPDVTLDVKKHINSIRTNFNSSEVRNDQIGALKDEMGRVLGLIIDDISRELKDISKRIDTSLENIKNSFIKDLVKDLTTTVDILKKQLLERENYKKQYEKLFEQIEKDIIR